MADADVNALAKDVNDLTTALQELGIIGNAYGKTAGILEKQQGKLKAAFNKNPIVQITKSFTNMGKQVKLFTKVTSEVTSVSKEQTEQNMKNASGLTKLAIHIATTTAFGERMSKMMVNQVSLWRRLTMSVFGIMSIFLLVVFAIAAVSVAFQGAETPLLDYTNGIPVLDEALKGLIMAMTGEGEGGLLGALNVVTAALVIAIPVWFLFGGTAALIVGSLILIAGTYYLVEEATGSSTAAFAAAAVVLMLVAAAILYVQASALVAAGTFATIGASWAGIIAGLLLVVALVVGGIIGIWMVLSGKINGWLGVMVAAISAAAIAAGIMLFVGFAFVPFAIIALVIFVVVMIIKYWDEIAAFFIAAGKWCLDGLIFLGTWIGGFIVGILASVRWVLTAIIGVIILVVGVAIGIILFPFLFIWRFGKNMWNSFQKARKDGWRGIVMWIIGIPALFKKTAGQVAKGIVNKITGVYNWFAKKMRFKIPKWVPLIGGGEWGLPIIPKLAKGGIVTKPTLAMIGEAGPEAVVPLSGSNAKNAAREMGVGGRGSITININASGITDRTDKRALAREIGEAIREEMNRGGRGHGTRRGAV